VEEVPEVTDEIEENLINKEPVVDETENNPVNNQHHDNNGPNISEGDNQSTTNIMTTMDQT